MTELQPPSYAQGECYTAQQDRMLWASLICEPGVSGPDDLAVSATPQPLQVRVAGGTAFVHGATTDDQGVYHVVNTGSVTLTLNDPDVTDDRIDLIVARVYDAQYDEGEVSEWRIEVVQGSPSPAPSAPAVEGSAIPLASVVVHAGSTTISQADVTDLRGQYVLCDGHTGGAIELGPGVNLNTLTRPGIYTQGSNSEANSGSNYPPASAGDGNSSLAGVLEVFSTPAGQILWQRYSEYHTGFVVWQRSMYGGSWSPWIPIGGAGDWSLSPITAASNVGSLGPIPGGSHRGVNRRGAIALQFQWTGPQLTTDTIANLPDTLLFTIAGAAYRPPRDTMIFIERPGLNTFIGRVNANGQAYLTGGSFPGQNFVQGPYRINAQWGPT